MGMNSCKFVFVSMTVCHSFVNLFLSLLQGSERLQSCVQANSACPKESCRTPTSSCTSCCRRNGKTIVGTSSDSATTSEPRTRSHLRWVDWRFRPIQSPVRTDRPTCVKNFIQLRFGPHFCCESHFWVSLVFVILQLPRSSYPSPHSGFQGSWTSNPFPDASFMQIPGSLIILSSTILPITCLVDSVRAFCSPWPTDSKQEMKGNDSTIKFFVKCTDKNVAYIA